MISPACARPVWQSWGAAKAAPNRLMQRHRHQPLQSEGLSP
jgi:hypothetical protein